MNCRTGLALIVALFTFYGRAQTQPHIIAFNKAGDLIWTNVIPGHYYSVQSKPVVTAAWTNLAGGLDNLQATGATTVVKIPAQTAQAFFTVVDRGSCCQNTGGAALGSGD
jgi:hypothetical protein